MAKSILLVGGSGYVGTHVARALRDHYKVFATYFTHPFTTPGVTYLPFSIDNKNWVKRVLHTIQPEVIVYLVGSNNSKWVEANHKMADRLHATGPAALISATEIMQPRFIYISNSYVFDGAKGNYHEADTVLPNTTMGRIKLGGENIVRSKFLNYVVIRSSPLIGRSNGLSLSPFDHLRISLARNQRYEASPYEVHSFSHIDGFCELLAKVIDSGFRNRVINFGGLTKVSQFEFAQLFAKRFNFNPSLILPKKGVLRKGGYSEDYVFDYSLNSTQTVGQLKIKPLLLEECFDLVEKQLIPST